MRKRTRIFTNGVMDNSRYGNWNTYSVGRRVLWDSHVTSDQIRLWGNRRDRPTMEEIVLNTVRYAQASLGRMPKLMGLWRETERVKTTHRGPHRLSNVQTATTWPSITPTMQLHMCWSDNMPLTFSSVRYAKHVCNVGKEGDQAIYRLNFMLPQWWDAVEEFGAPHDHTTLIERHEAEYGPVPIVTGDGRVPADVEHDVMGYMGDLYAMHWDTWQRNRYEVFPYRVGWETLSYPQVKCHPKAFEDGDDMLNFVMGLDTDVCNVVFTLHGDHIEVTYSGHDTLAGKLIFKPAAESVNFD